MAFGEDALPLTGGAGDVQIACCGQARNAPTRGGCLPVCA